MPRPSGSRSRSLTIPSRDLQPNPVGASSMFMPMRLWPGPQRILPGLVLVLPTSKLMVGTGVDAAGSGRSGTKFLKSILLAHKLFASRRDRASSASQ